MVGVIWPGSPILRRIFPKSNIFGSPTVSKNKVIFAVMAAAGADGGVEFPSARILSLVAHSKVSASICATLRRPLNLIREHRFWAIRRADKLSHIASVVQHWTVEITWGRFQL